MSFALARQFKRNGFEGLALSLSFGWLVRKTVYQLIPKVIPSNNWRLAHPVDLEPFTHFPGKLFLYFYI